MSGQVSVLQRFSRSQLAALSALLAGAVPVKLLACMSTI